MTKDVVRAKQLYGRAVDAGDTRAMCNLGGLYERGEKTVPKYVLRAKQLYESGAARGQFKARYGLSRLQKAKNSSSLSTAFCQVLSDLEVLDQTFVVICIRSNHVKLVMDVLAGHNVLPFAIRTGVVTCSNLVTVGGSR